MGPITRLRERWRGRKGATAKHVTAKGDASAAGDIESSSDPGDAPSPPGTAVGLTSRPSMANATIGQSIVILFEDMNSGFWRFTADVQAWLGLTRAVTQPPPTNPRDVIVTEVARPPQAELVVPDPPLMLPRFGNWPSGERLGNNTCGPVDTYFKVRSKMYLKTRIKERSAPRMFEFLGADMIRGAAPARDICAHPDGIIASPGYQRLYKAALKKRALGDRRRTFFHGDAKQSTHESGGARDVEPPFIFAINFSLPRAPALAPEEYVNIVTYFGRVGKSDNATWEALWERFLGMTPQQRGSRLKLLPVIVTGPQTFQNSIANKPAIIGNKLKCSWFESQNHLECIVEVGTSLLASQMWKLMLPQSKHLAMDMAWLIEGQTEDELPEVVVAAAHLSRPDLSHYRLYEALPRAPTRDLPPAGAARAGKPERRLTRRASRKSERVAHGAAQRGEQLEELAVRTRTI